MNLAQSLLAASERHPRLEAFPGLTYADLLPRVARLAGGLHATPGSRVAVVLDNRLDTALLYWASQWAGAVFVPLSWRLSDEELAYCIADAGAEIVIRDGDPLPDGPEHPGALDRDGARDLTPPLHVGHDRDGRRAFPARMRRIARAASDRHFTTAT